MRFALALAAMVVVGPAVADDAGERYATAYRMVGFRVRATYVCPGDKRAMTQRAFSPISSHEFRTFSKAFHETTEGWMTEGAGVFNDAVMQDGINEACRRAR